MQQIVASVGLGGRNHPFDVNAVQRLLARAGVSPGPIDGRCGIRTIRAIEHYQHGFLHRPDGRVDRDGPTWRHLQHGTPAPAARATAATPRPAASSRPMAPAPARAPAPAAAPPPGPGPTPAAPHIPPVVPPPPRRPRPAAAAPAATPRPAPATPHAAPAPSSHAPAPPAASHDPGKPEPAAYWQQVTPLVAWSEVNRGLQSPPNSVVKTLLGDPHDAKIKGLLVTRQIGGIHTTGLRPAMDSLSAIMGEVQRDLPDLYALVRTSGMLAVRAVRGRTNYSNHSWGIAIDIRIGSVLIPLGAHYSVRGVDALVGYFNLAGWYWGGGYHGRKDPMHFECSTSLLRSFGL